MRIALLADVHGDLEALEAVLRDAERRGAEGVVHLGDLAGGADPGGVVARVRADGLTGVVGDADLEALAAPGTSEEVRSFLGDLPAQLLLQEGDTAFLLVHASPEGARQGLDETTPEARLEHIFGTTGVQVIVCGHTHRPLARRVGERVLLNPGCVGRGLGSDPRPSYLILDTEGGLAALHVRVDVCR